MDKAEDAAAAALAEGEKLKDAAKQELEKAKDAMSSKAEDAAGQDGDEGGQ